MKQYSIAVCMSGQSRTWKTALPAIKRFFNSLKADVKFFGHTWDENTWRASSDHPGTTEKLCVETLREELQAAFNFERLIIDEQIHQFINGGKVLPWSAMLKSSAKSMHLKTQYEIETGRSFDMVYHVRFDFACSPHAYVDLTIPDVIEPDTVYCSRNSFAFEYRQPCIDDIFYYGSSRVMTMIDGFWHYYSNRRFHALHNYNSTRNPTLDRYGVGVMLYKWVNDKCIKMVDIPRNIGPFVVRLGTEHLNWPLDHEALRDAYRNF